MTDIFLSILGKLMYISTALLQIPQQLTLSEYFPFYFFYLSLLAFSAPDALHGLLRNFQFLIRRDNQDLDL
jgi:hypothetical protein